MDIKPKRDADVERFNPKKVYNKEDLIAATSLLQIRTSEIRQSKLNWQTYLQLQIMGQRDFDYLVHLDQRGQKDLPDKSPEICADVFLNLVAHMNIDNALQYVLVLIDEILSEDKSRVKIFRNSRHGNVWQIFLKLFYNDDEFVRYMSARIIAKLACWHPQLMEKNELEHYLSWLRDELKKSNNEYIQSAARCLQMMLRVDEYRFVFLAIDGVPTLLSILATRVNFQVQYQLIFCLWAITFNPLLAEKMNKFNVISVLADILSESVKEKVSRIVLAVYRNLIEKTEDRQVAKGHCIAMVQCKVLKQLYILEHKNSDDEDFMNDVAFLTERLQASMQDLSSFDQYATEVKSGRLEWSPVHKSTKFWRENAARLSEGGQELLRALVQVLEKSRDPVVLAVACYDVGEYVRHYPRGKHFIEQLGGKHRVMFLIGHEDPNVRYEALLAVQKLMVHNWEYLGKQLENEQLEKQPAAGAKA